MWNCYWYNTEVLEIQCSTLEQNWRWTTVSLLQVSFCAFWKKLFIWSQLKLELWLTFHMLSPLKAEHNIWNNTALSCQRMKNVSTLKDSISHLCNGSLYIFFQGKVHVNSLASLKQLCVSSLLEKPRRTLFSIFYWLACNLLGNCRKWTDRSSSHKIWLNILVYIFFFMTWNTRPLGPTITKNVNHNCVIQTSKALNMLLTHLF